MRWAAAFVFITLLVAGSPGSAAAQSRRGATRDSARVVAARGYGAGAMHRFLLGDGYRDLWTATIDVPVLDLGTFGGGLTPTERGGGMQTASLRLVAADGTEYTFRSVDKDPSSILPPELRETLVDELVQDQISASHPAGALVVDPILEAVGVLHAVPLMVQMPDDPRLGGFRAEFAGMLGIIEERPEEAGDRPAGFEGAENVIGTERLLERLEEEIEFVEARAFLAARLTDIFLGDWDRHRDQWRWARFGDDSEDLWLPIPRDRDQAFVHMDGVLLALGRQYYPQLVKFVDSYPSILGVTWNGRELDRRLLVGLERPAWDSVAASLQSRITDAVIDSAVARLPRQYDTLSGDVMRRRLVARRDALPEMSSRFYEFLATEVDVHTTDAAESARAVHGTGGLDVIVVAHNSAAGEVEVFRRRFLADETKEVRLFLHGGADTIRTIGDASGITLIVDGGGADDHLEDTAGGTEYYDADGNNTWQEGPGTSIDQRAWSPPVTSPSQPARDWGHRYRYPLWMGYSPDVGLLAGMGFERYDYGFRTLPWASRLKLRGAWATTAMTYRIDAQFRKNRENSIHHWSIDARASGLDILNFHGFGNETDLDQPDEAYEVELSQFTLDPRFVIGWSASTTLAIGPTIAWSKTDNTGTNVIDSVQPYGAGEFGSAGLVADLQIDGRDRARSPTSGFLVEAGVTTWPAVFDVEEAFSAVRVSAAAYLSPWQPLRPTLAFRIGARRLFGTYPFQKAAYIGDVTTARLGRDQRYAGDALVHGNVELRTRLGNVRLVIPAEFGILGLADVGRVWFEEEKSDKWHGAAGGGVWLGFLGAENAIAFTLARSEERTGFYVTAGFAW
ncbi:MAG: hypothetical protein ACREL7_04465 [Longimicrobiales bacterium]